MAGRLIGAQDAQRHFRPGAAGTEMPEDLPNSRHGVAVPTDDAVAHQQASPLRLHHGSARLELDNDGTGTALAVAQRMQLNRQDNRRRIVPDVAS